MNPADNETCEDMREQVDLPDPEVQPLVHPLDLPEAGRLFRLGRLLTACTSVPVAALLAAVVGYASGNAIGPIALFLVMVVLGTLAARWYTDRAWDYIPRKRQDRERPLSRRWDVLSGGVLALVLGVVLLLVVFRLDGADVRADVRSYTFGMAAVAAVLVLADTAIGLSRSAGRRRALASLPGVTVVVLATVLAYAVWFDHDADAALVFWGALTMAAVAILAGAHRLWERRRAAGARVSA
jgi:O-antigen/teichoic acid export membrane protein